MMTSQIGGQVDISCGAGDQEGTEWRFNNRVLGARHLSGVNGSRLTLEDVRVKDTGTYTCLRNGTKVKGVRLLVGEPPKTPNLSCLLKSYLRPITCQWHSRELKRLTKCILSYRTSLQQNVTLKPCKFYTSRQVCVCMVPHTEGEYEHYFIALAVSNGISCSRSKERMFTFDSLLRSDPPEMVRVRPVRKAPHKLNVTWVYPQSWQRGFYALKFEVTYGVQGELFFKSVVVKDTAFLIADALPDKNYTVLVRAQEEFSHGSWSEWSPEAFGVPWADPRRNMVPQEDVEGYPSTDIECEACSLEEKTPQESHHPERNVFPDYVLCLVVTCLAGVTILFVIMLVRYRKKWRTQVKGKGQEEAQPESLGISLIRRPQAQQDPKDREASAETPFQGEPGALPSEEEGDDHSQEEASQFDVTNPGYYYIPQ
ncbi:interleukin-6 receptor subunit alpha-like [Pristis pectinata]|uniref:interleukin-6 receptor subunit alpha-like n=1 Tax=Pristis pectinata TaxID=685728 RepID=UPI00223D14D4|nr:interleukin-6 receptor subunit alpha-like [Pristis pectinata]